LLFLGKEIYAPCNGKVVEVFDGYEERAKAHVISIFLWF